MKIAYIVSSSYSGSTLLSFILNAHPKIGTISEFDRMHDIGSNPEFLCSCGLRIRQCPFFVELESLLRGQGFRFAIDDMDMTLSLHGNWRINQILAEKIPLFQSSGLENLRSRIVDSIPYFTDKKETFYTRNDAFMRAILDLQKAEIFLDANKNPYRLRVLRKRYDVRAIYLFKNGIPNVYSYVKNTADSSHPLGVEAATRRWFEEQITISRSLKYLDPTRVLQVSYTDMCNDVPATAKRICELLDIEYAPLDNYAHVPHHIIGNRMRLGKISEIKERTDWKERLSRADVEQYRRVAEKCLPALRAVNPAVTEHIWL